MDQLPVLTEDLALRLEQAAIVFGRAWLSGIADLELGDFGPDLLVGVQPGCPELDFQNRVNGLTPAHASIVPAIAAFYSTRGVRPWFELVPSSEFAPLAEALREAGAAHIGYHSLVYGAVADPAAGEALSNESIEIEVVDGAEPFAEFARLRVAGYDLPAEVRERAAADLNGWNHATGTTLYIARVDGEAAGTAALCVHDGIGYLADGAALPAFRGRGVQTSLINRRRHDAAAAGCNLLSSQTEFGGTSHRNLQRAGLIGGFTKAVWRVMPGS